MSIINNLNDAQQLICELQKLKCNITLIHQRTRLPHNRLLKIASGEKEASWHDLASLHGLKDVLTKEGCLR